MHMNALGSKWPETRKEFWRKKLQSNRKRDAVQLAELKKQNIRTLIVWECSLTGSCSLGAELAARLVDTWLQSGAMTGEIVPDGLHITDVHEQ